MTYNTTTTAPAHMLAAGTVIADGAGDLYRVDRVEVEGGDVLAWIGPEPIRYYADEAVEVVPAWEAALLGV